MNLDELLAADASAPIDSRQRLASFHPSLMPLFQMAVELFEIFDKCMQEAFDKTVTEGAEIVRQQASTLGVTEVELNQALKGGKCPGSNYCQARAAYLRRQAAFARATIFWLLNRQFLWGVTDLLRMRIVAAEGYGRLQAESIGLLLNIADDYNVGARWLAISTAEEETRFYRDLQGQLKKAMRGADLAFAYDLGSSSAQHVRVKSAIHGLSFSDTEARMTYLDVRDDDPCSHFLAVAAFLTTQMRVFRALRKAFPEVIDSAWLQRLGTFEQDVRSVWQQLAQRFPDEYAEHHG